jgi:hypothetical protein
MAAQNGTIFLLGLETGRTLNVDIYLPDAVATAWTFNPAAAAVAGSPASYRLPEKCVLRDVSMATAPTATGCFVTKNGNPIIGSALRYTNQLAALPNRAQMSIVFEKGDFIGATQF